MQYFRPVIAFVGSMAVFSAFFLNKISGEAFMGFIAATVIFWYKSRDETKK